MVYYMFLQIKAVMFKLSRRELHTKFAFVIRLSINQNRNALTTGAVWEALWFSPLSLNKLPSFGISIKKQMLIKAKGSILWWDQRDLKDKRTKYGGYVLESSELISAINWNETVLHQSS